MTYKKLEDVTFQAVYLNEEIPNQGWKIHISAYYDNYNLILDLVDKVCRYRRINYKYVKNPQHLDLFLSSKSHELNLGKLITIYPSSNKVFLSVIEELYVKLKNFEGPQVLTDRRYKNSQVLYFRYGVFIGETNIQRGMLLDSKGNKFTDLEKPWYSIPSFIEEIVEETDEDIQTIPDKYNIQKILYKNSTGNVYLGENLLTKKKIVLKEARYKTGTDINVSSIDLLKNEQNIFIKWRFLKIFPEIIDSFFLDNNYYIVEEFIEGEHLYELDKRFNILTIENEGRKREIENFIKKSIDFLTKIHLNGLLLDDISLSNIIYDGERLYFIDGETIFHQDNPHKYYCQSINYVDERYEKIDLFKKDQMKLSYMLMCLLTGYSNLLENDRSGRNLRVSFIRSAQNFGLNNETIKSILKLLDNEQELLCNEVPIRSEIEKIYKNIKQTIELNYFSESFENITDFEFFVYFILRYSITIKGFNYTNPSLNVVHKMAALEFLYKSNKKDTVRVRDKKKLIGYKKKDYYIMLACIFYLRFEKDSDVENKLIDTIDFFITEKIKVYMGIHYVVNEEYYDPYLEGGNAGLILIILKYQMLMKNDRYEMIIKNISKGISFHFSKSIGLANGISGIGLVNLKLFEYTGKKEYQYNFHNIIKNLLLFTTEYNNSTIFIDPISKPSICLKDGLVGQYILLTEMRRYYEKTDSNF